MILYCYIIKHVLHYPEHIQLHRSIYFFMIKLPPVKYWVCHYLILLYKKYVKIRFRSL